MAENRAQHDRQLPQDGHGRHPRSALSVTPVAALSLGGIILMYVAGLVLLGLIAVSFYNINSKLNAAPGTDLVTFVVTAYFYQLLLFVAALVSAGIGYGLLRAAGTATRDVISARDYQLISQMLLENNREGIDNYIRLSSLTGVIGTFTKLGLPGLPLATIGLTIMFALLGIFVTGPLSNSFIDLAKLTLGAFIGSYVQRASSDVQRVITDSHRPSAATQPQVTAQGSAPGAGTNGNSAVPAGSPSPVGSAVAAGSAIPVVDRAG